ncbi:hypothetical protein NPIL_190871 [Nephila pilipes]|uniref:Uncharacterized protein n=1 Tax=Nephila pilipes TaxID=299642 RepID=A0A8X6TX72_NEPPI|nr:hypothetical protein NPIL_190871 [Nephila pilipes]
MFTRFENAGTLKLQVLLRAPRYGKYYTLRSDDPRVNLRGNESTITGCGCALTQRMNMNLAGRYTNRHIRSTIAG